MTAMPTDTYLAVAHNAPAYKTNPELFDEWDIPKQSGHTMETCPDCGGMKRIDSRCPFKNCDSNLSREQAVAALKEVRAALHNGRKDQANKALLVALNLLSGDGINELNPRQCRYLRGLLDAAEIEPSTSTAMSQTWSFDLEEEYGVANIHLSLPKNPSRPGVLKAVRPSMYVDESAEWDQSLSESDPVLEFIDFQAERSRREGARLIMQAHAIKSRGV